MNESQHKFTIQAIHRKQIYLLISIISVIFGLGLTLYYGWLSYTVDDFDKGVHFILVILILLNARQNFRQYVYASILQTMLKPEELK